MDTAINKTTNKPVNAFEVMVNPSYQNLDKTEWILNIYDDKLIYTGNKLDLKNIRVSFVNGFERNNKPVRPFFRVLNAKEKGISFKPESDKHEKAKSMITGMILKNKFEFFTKDNKSINIDKDKFDFSRLQFEFSSVSWLDIRREADVFLPLKKRDEFLGWGIVFEIQLSKQDKEITIKRTLDWTAKGYSVVWIWDKDFNNNGTIEDKPYELFSFLEYRKNIDYYFLQESKKYIEEQNRKMDLKFEEGFEKINKISYEKIFYDIEKSDAYDDLINKLLDKSTGKINQIKERYDILSADINKDFEQVKNKLNDIIIKNKNELNNFNEKIDIIEKKYVGTLYEQVKNKEIENIYNNFTQKIKDKTEKLNKSFSDFKGLEFDPAKWKIKLGQEVCNYRIMLDKEREEFRKKDDTNKLYRALYNDVFNIKRELEYGK